MLTITSVHEMQSWVDAQRAAGKRIGLVPTMGYLHAGHLSLVAQAGERSDVVVASIFVNPLQFGANEDLSRYPRNIEGDTRLLDAAGAAVLFLPSVNEMYPEGYQTAVSVDLVTQGLCGASRPTHFRGVTTVVAKLFNMTKPHVAVFGAKDFQQLVAIRRMVADLNFGIEIVGAPIVREADGLAMSSRNAYLSPDERRAALCLSRALAASCHLVEQGERDALRIVGAARRVIAEEPLARIDYVSLVDADNLQQVTELQRPALLALAVGFGKTRLIDNCVLSQRSTVESQQPSEPTENTLDCKLSTVD
ncbi:MAG: pantoate--beta-alanine ligase [Deltaproteobacteria bacterium]|nr:pantoate--beta-alanine ligase [Deltaproteobacteria bacterium]